MLIEREGVEMATQPNMLEQQNEAPSTPGPEREEEHPNKALQRIAFAASYACLQTGRRVRHRNTAGVFMGQRSDMDLSPGRKTNDENELSRNKKTQK